MRERMELMTRRSLRVLHPLFEEDEMMIIREFSEQ